MQQHLGGGRCRSTGSYARRAGAPKPLAERTRTAHRRGGESPRRERGGGEPPNSQCPRLRLGGTSKISTFDSRWVPPVGGAPSRHTGTGGATTGVHAQCLRDSGAGDTSLVVPRAAARRSQVVPQSKQLAARRGDVERSKRLASSQARRCQGSRGDARADQWARTGGAKKP
jgi:hypothetical protein